MTRNVYIILCMVRAHGRSQTEIYLNFSGPRARSLRHSRFEMYVFSDFEHPKILYEYHDIYYSLVGGHKWQRSDGDDLAEIRDEPFRIVRSKSSVRIERKRQEKFVFFIRITNGRDRTPVRMHPITLAIVFFFKFY